MWSKLKVAYKKKYKENFPICLEKLLKDAGYKSLASLKKLNETKLDGIETFLNDNKDFVNQLKCCFSDTYKSLKVFKFIPGHRDTIISLTEILPDIEHISKERTQTARAESDDICLKKKTKISEVSLRQKLLKGLKSVARKQNFEVFNGILSDANISEFEEIKEQCQCGQNCNTHYQCRFVCPVCPKNYKLTYKKFWMSSIATKHIKKHILQQKNASN